MPIPFKLRPDVLAVLVFAIPAMGQEPGEPALDGNPVLEEVIVTASRREETLQNVGMAIASIDPGKFDQAGLGTLENVIDYTPGVHYNAGTSVGQGNLSMRGATQEYAIPVVGQYVDDVPLTSNTPHAWGSTVLYDGVLGDIERIEVVKGPQGTLYGAGSVGGIIRYVSRDPATGEFRGRASVDFSNTAHGDWNQQYRAYVSMPLVKDTLGITVAGFHSDQAGFIDRVDTPSVSARKNVNDSVTDSLSLIGLWTISETASLKLTALTYDVEFDGENAVNFEYPAYVPTYGPYQSTEPDLPAELEYENYSATFRAGFGWAELISVTAWVEYHPSGVGDETRTFGPLADLLTGSPPGTNSVPVSVVVGSEKFVQELRLVSPPGERMEWLAGFFYTDEDTENTQQAIAVPTGFVFFDVAYPSAYEEKAVFGNWTWYITPAFDVTLGGRYSDISLSLDARFAGLFGAGDPNGELLFEGATGEQVVTRLLGARWRPNDDVSLYARIASGYRPPFVNLPIFDPATGANLAPLIVDSDELWSYELGIKGQAQSGRLNYDFALWATDWDEFQTSFTFLGISTATNARTSLVAAGLEGAMTWYPHEDWAIYGSFAYTDAELEDDDPVLGGASGERPRRLPEWTAALKTDYTFRLAENIASIGGGVRYVGDYHTAYRGGQPGCGCPVDFPVDAYTLMDLNAGLYLGRYSLRIYVTNLFDEYALANAEASAGATGVIAATGAIVQPRTVGAMLAVDF